MREESQAQPHHPLMRSLFESQVIVIPASDKRMSKCPEGYTLAYKESGSSDDKVWCRWRILFKGQPTGRDMAVRFSPDALQADEERTARIAKLTSYIIRATQREVDTFVADAVPTA